LASPNKWPIVSSGPTANKGARPVVRGMTPTTPAAHSLGIRGKFLGGAGLSDARLPGQHHDAAMAVHGFVHRGPKPGHLPLTPNEYPVRLPRLGQAKITTRVLEYFIPKLRYSELENERGLGMDHVQERLT